MTGENLTRDQILDLTSKKLIRLAKSWKLNTSNISIAIKYILDIYNSKWGLTEEELIEELNSFKDEIKCKK